jgi:hypothetical protein
MVLFLSPPAGLPMHVLAANDNTQTHCAWVTTDAPRCMLAAVPGHVHTSAACSMPARRKRETARRGPETPRTDSPAVSVEVGT